MGADDEITQWILRLGHGDEGAAQALWEQYFRKLVRVAERELRGMPRRAVDEEDVALSAMQSFCRGLADQRFQELKDREELWKLLVTITARKAAAQRRKHYALKRGGGKVRGDSIFDRGDADDASGSGLAGSAGVCLGDQDVPLEVLEAATCGPMLVVRHFVAQLPRQFLRFLLTRQKAIEQQQDARQGVAPSKVGDDLLFGATVLPDRGHNAHVLVDGAVGRANFEGANKHGTLSS